MFVFLIIEAQPDIPPPGTEQTSATTEPEKEKEEVERTEPELRLWEAELTAREEEIEQVKIVEL